MEYTVITCFSAIDLTVGGLLRRSGEALIGVSLRLRGTWVEQLLIQTDVKILGLKSGQTLVFYMVSKEEVITKTDERMRVV